MTGPVFRLTFSTTKVKKYDTTNQILLTTNDKIGADGLVISGTDASYRLSSKTLVIGVKSGDLEGSTVNTPVEYTKVFAQDYNNVVVVSESKNSGAYNEVVAIFVDEDNEMTSRTGGGSATSSGPAGSTITVAAAAMAGANAANFSVVTNKATAVTGEAITVTVTTTTAHDALLSATVTGVGATISPTTVLDHATIGKTYTFTVTAGSAAITAITVTATTGTFSVGAQSGTITAADTTQDTATFAVTGAAGADGATPVITWYTAAVSGSVTTAPGAAAVTVSNVVSGASTVTIKDTATANSITAGSYYFTVTINGIESAVATLAVS